MIKAELARLYLRAYHKLIKGPRFVKVLGERFIVLPGVLNPIGTYSTSLVARNISVKKGEDVLEVGCGSGVLAVFAAKMGARVVAVDSSEEAIRCTRVNVALHGVFRRVEVILGNLYEPVTRRKFDRIISNPPYLPLEPRDDLDRHWCCGSDLSILRQLIVGLPEHLKPKGRALLTFSSLTGVSAMKKILSEAGLKWRVVDKARTPLDTIFLVEIGVP